MAINWDEMLGGGFITIEEGKPKQLVLRNWKVQDKFKDEKTGQLKPGLVFEVWGEDGKVYNEKSKLEYTVTAMGALKQFKPLCQEAEAKGQNEIKVSVVSVGKGTQKKYSINKI